MINLYQYLTEGIFDVDDNIDNIERNALIQKWINDQSLSDNYWTQNTKWKIQKDGSISVDSTNVAYVTGEVPKYIKITGDKSPDFLNCTIECLDSIQCNILNLSNTVIKDFGKGFKGDSVRIQSCKFDKFDWLPNSIDYLDISHYHIDRFDISKTTINRNLNISYSDIEVLEDVSVRDTIYISDCKKLKKIKNVKCGRLCINDCPNLECFEGDNKIESIDANAACKKFKPINLPKNLENVYCTELGKDWIETNVMELNPDLKLKTKGFPDARQWKSDIDLYKPGTYVCAKSKPRSYGSWGSSPTRGTLAVDQVVKVTPSGRIKCDYSGLRPAMDVELMRDANPKKDWNYKDPNGLNDITGVGIEIGDEVIVYEKGQGHLSIDIVSGLTKAKIRCEKNGLRSPEDICIMRGQKECEKLFK